MPGRGFNINVSISLTADKWVSGGRRAARASENLDRQNRRADRSTRRLDRALSRLGRTVATIGLAALASQAARVAIEFDDSLAKVSTLVGVAREQVQGWRGDLQRLAVDAGRGPTELANALFVVTSAGERGAGALEVVDRSARAAAVGLGQTEQIARAVTAAIQAYGPAQLDAARATDVLVATVREGNLEASELAGVLGRVLGIASQVGVSFGEVGGFIATFTRLGVDSAEAVTALRGILSALLKPTADADAALRRYGTSLAGLREEIRQRGLARALVDLIQRLDGNDDALTKLIPNIRALAGVFGVAGAQADAYLEIADKVVNSTGILSEAFEGVADRPGQAMRRLGAQIDNLRIAFGDELARGAAEAAGSLDEVTASAEDLRELGKLAGLAVRGLAQATVFLAQNVDVAKGLLAVLVAIKLPAWAAASAAAVAKLWAVLAAHPLVAVTAAVTALTLIGVDRWARRSAAATAEMVEEMGKVRRVIDDAAAVAESLDQVQIQTSVEAYTQRQAEAREAVAAAAQETKRYEAQVRDAKAAVDEQAKAMHELARRNAEANEDLKTAALRQLKLSEALKEAKAKLEAAAGEQGKAEAVARAYAAGLEILRGALKGVADEEERAGDGARSSGASRAALSRRLESLRRQLDAVKQIRQEARELQALMRAREFDQFWNVDGILSETAIVTEAIERGLDPLEDLDERTRSWLEKLILVRSEWELIQDLAEQTERLSERLTGDDPLGLADPFGDAVQRLVDEMPPIEIPLMIPEGELDELGRTAGEAAIHWKEALSKAFLGSVDEFAVAMREVAIRSGDEFARRLGIAAQQAASIESRFPGTQAGQTAGAAVGFLRGLGTVRAAMQEGGAEAMGFANQIEGLAAGAAQAASGAVELAHSLGFISDEAFRASRELSALGAAIGQAIGGELGGAIGQGVGALLGGLGLELGRTASSALNTAALGAQVGAMFGPVGAAWGAVVGAGVGLVLDMFASAAQTFGDGSTAGGRLVAQMHEGAGELREQTQQILDGITGTVNGILDAIGGTFTSFTTFGVQIREDSQGIRVWIDGVVRTFGEDVQAAMDFAVTEIFRRTEVGGVSDVVRGALRSFAGETAEELQAVLQDALTIEALGFTELERQLRADLAELNRLLLLSIQDFGAGAERVLMGPGGVVATIDAAYNAAFGIGQDVEAQTRANIAAVQAQVLAEQAHLLALRASIEAQAAQARITSERVQIEVSGMRAFAQAAAASGEAHAAYAGVVAATGQVVAETAATTAQALAAIDAALAHLASFDFSDEAIDRAVRQARRAARGAAGVGRGDGAADRERQRQDFLREMEENARALRGVSDAAREMAASLERVEEWIDAARELGIAEEALAQARRDALDLLTQDFLAPFREAAAAAGETEFETSLRHLFERFGDAFEAAAELARERADTFGTSFSQELAGIMSVLDEAFAADFMETVRDEVRRLAQAGDLEGLRALQEMLAGLAVDPDVPQHIREAISSLGEFPEIAQAIAEAEREVAEASAAAIEAERERARQLHDDQLSFLSGLRRFGIEIPGLEEALLRAEIARERRRAIELFSTHATAEAAGRLGEVLGAVAPIIDTTSRGVLTAFTGMAHGTIEISQRMARGIVLEMGGMAADVVGLIRGARDAAKEPGGAGAGGILEILRGMRGGGGRGESILPGIDLTLDELLAMLDQALEDGLAAIAAGAGAGRGPGGAGPFSDLLSSAESFLDQLSQMEARGLDPLARVNLEFNELLSRANELAEAFPALGTSLGEVRERVEALRRAALEDEVRKASAGIQQIFDRLTATGGLERSAFDQVAAAQAEFDRLLTEARAGSLEAREALGPVAQELERLAPLLFGQSRGAQAILERIRDAAGELLSPESINAAITNAESPGFGAEVPAHVRERDERDRRYQERAIRTAENQVEAQGRAAEVLAGLLDRQLSKADELIALLDDRLGPDRGPKFPEKSAPRRF